MPDAQKEGDQPAHAVAAGEQGGGGVLPGLVRDELRVPYELLVVVQVGPCAAGP